MSSTESMRKPWSGQNTKCLQAVWALAVLSLLGGWEAARLQRVGRSLWATVECLLRGSKTCSEDSKQKHIKMVLGIDFQRTELSYKAVNAGTNNPS
jgi:hypothetical protein